MKSITIGAFVIATMLLSSAGTAIAMSNNFICGTNRVDLCSCSGSTDCRSMRRSGICSGPMICSASGCSCAVVNVVRGKSTPGNGISGVSGMRPGGKVQSPPALKPKPQRPLLPILKN